MTIARTTILKLQTVPGRPLLEKILRQKMTRAAHPRPSITIIIKSAIIVQVRTNQNFRDKNHNRFTFHLPLRAEIGNSL